MVRRASLARANARRAVAVLRDEGVVYAVPQRGTYVAEPSGNTEP